VELGIDFGLRLFVFPMLSEQDCHSTYEVSVMVNQESISLTNDT
jgi:hypothetical protein